MMEEIKTEKNIRCPIPDCAGGVEASIYYIEITSECNLKCKMCPFGSRELFQREHGIMTLEKFKEIVDEIAKRSPCATVSPYHHCEPFLHPQLAEMVKIIKEHNMFCAISTNFNYVKGIKEILDAGVDVISISVSGYYQNTYAKNHVGGDIEKVKKNMSILSELMRESENKPQVEIVYHMYTDNIADDFEKMKEFATECGFAFVPIWSRAISLEMTLKYLREKGYSHYTGETYKWFDELPRLTEAYYECINRMIHLPEDYLQEKWLQIDIDECLTNRKIINIRWNGKISLCSWGFDDRLSFYEYLTTPMEKIYQLRSTSPICRECIANRYVLYTNYYDMDEINDIARKRLPENLDSDRKF